MSHVYRALLRFALALLALLFFASSAKALLIEVTGTTGSGATTWKFSGDSTVSGLGSILIDINDSDIGWGWDVGSSFYSGSNKNIDFTSTSASLSDGTNSFAIQGIGAAGFNPGRLFGIAVGGTFPAIFGNGTKLSFSGSGVAPVDISEFATGITHLIHWDDDVSILTETLTGVINVTAKAPSVPPPSVPPPSVPDAGSTLALLGLALAGLSLARRRTIRD